MGLFGIKKNIDKWAAVVMPGSKGPVPEKLLEDATELYIKQHTRILDDSIRLFLTSKNKETRKSRYKLACEHYGALIRVKKYADRDQRKIIDQKIDAFVQADNIYRHPDRAKVKPSAKENDFWEAYGITEMIEIFSEDWK